MVPSPYPLESDFDYWLEEEYPMRWRDLEWLVACEPDAEAHTMDLLMGRS